MRARVASLLLVAAFLAALPLCARAEAGPSPKEALAALPEEDRHWLDFVTPIILPAEKKAFLELTDARDRELFKEEFWKRREKDGQAFPMGPGYRNRFQDLRDLAEAKYDHWPNDAARMVIRYGEPANINELQDCRRTFRDLEVWTYQNASGLGSGRHYFFYRRSQSEARKMWTVGTADSDVFSPGSCRKSFDQLRFECGTAPPAGQEDPCARTPKVGPPAPSGTVCAEVCDILNLWTEISSRQGSRTGGAMEEGGLLSPPDVSLEGLDGIKNRSANASDPNAAKLSVTAPSAVPVTLPDKTPLSEDDKKWLDFVAPIILPAEKKAFLDLSQPHDREAFQDAFWLRREASGMAPPLGPGYRARFEELRRLADEQYDRWPNDAAALVIRRGEPASIDKTECDRVFRDLEIWTYTSIGGNVAGVSSGFKYIFYRRSPHEPRRMWTVGTPEADVFNPASCRKTFSSLQTDCHPAANDNCVTCIRACDVFNAWQQVSSRQGSLAGGQIERAELQQPEKVPLEGLEAIKSRSANTIDPGAAKLSVSGPSGEATPSDTVAAADGQGAQAAAAAPPLPAAIPVTLPDKTPLSDDDKKWLDFVAPIILPEEKKAFLELTQPHEREAFQTEFWRRREQPNMKPPLGPGYRYRFEELRRLAEDQYDRWPNDAAAMVIRNGEPASIEKLDECNDMGGTALFRGLEIWTYSGGGGLGTFASSGRKYFFYRRSLGEPRRMWTVGTPDSDIFLPGACYTNFQSLSQSCTRNAKPCACMSACDIYKAWEQISSRQGSRTGAEMERAELQKPETVPLEGLESIKSRSANTTDPNAKKLEVQGPASTASAAATVAGNAPAPVHRKLSKKEIKELTDHLAPKYHDYLELVDLIITDQEREVFLEITDNYQKDQFIEAFWRRRSLNNQGLRTDYRAIYIQRWQVAHEQFQNMRSERAKIFMISGPPDAVLNIDCVDIYVPIQIWFYERLEVLKSKAYLLFYRQYGTGEYKLWLPLDGEQVLLGNGMSFGPGARNVDVTQCPEYRTVRQAEQYTAATLGTGAMSMAGASLLFQPPVVETEGVDQILNMTTDMAANAVTLGVTKLIRFPDQRANKIGVDMSLLVPRAELKSKQLGEEVFYNVDIIGEIVKDDRLMDNFKYRFDIPTDEVGGEKIPLTVRRYLYPGDYKMVLKVSDGNQNAEARITELIKVPEEPDAPPPIEAAARAAGKVAIEKTKEAGILPSAISLIPIAREIATGLQRFETKAAEGVSAVDFYLNGSKVMTKTRAPYEADLNLGPLPRKQVIRVVAYGPNGRAVGEDEYIVNEGREVFRVRILSPEKGAKATGPTPVVAAVAVPEGRTLQKIEFYSNETRVATLYQAPWEQTVNLRDTKSLGYVRVVGTLEDGTVAEDVRYVNAPSYISEVQVDAVELYTAVTDKSGRPVSGLQQTNFKVFEDGAIQKVESFEYVKNVPLSLGVLVDTSASMLESLPEAQQAAIGFLDYSIGPKDRGFTISFDSEPYVLSKLTNRKDKLYRSLAGLRAEGSTALYDAIVYGLYQFTGVKGKKAIVILSDGKDTSSKFDYDTLLEYVKKSGIAIYAIGLKIPTAELDVKYKLSKLAQVTGGQTFMIDSVKGLAAVYQQINDELRSQYLLTYYSTNPEAKDKWRKVDVKVEPTNLVARTLSGYYP